MKAQHGIRKKARLALWCAVCFCLAVPVVFPVMYAFLGSFRTAGEFSRLPPALFPDSFLNFDSYVQVFTRVPMARYFLNSLGTTALVCAVKICLSILAAYAFAFFEFRLKDLLFVVILGIMTWTRAAPCT